MVSFANANIRPPPEIWIMQTALKFRRNITTAEFATQYKYKDEGEALVVLNNLARQKRVKRIVLQDGSIEWNYR